MEERRLILAVALSLLVLTAYQLLFPPPPPRPAAGAAPSASAVPSGATAPSLPPAASPAAPVTMGAAPSAVASPAVAAPARVADDKEWRVELEAADLALVFVNKGARLLSWQLPEFKDRRGKPEEMVRILEGAVRPLDIETGDPGLDARLQAAPFRVSSEQVSAAPGDASTI